MSARGIAPAVMVDLSGASSTRLDRQADHVGLWGVVCPLGSLRGVEHSVRVHLTIEAVEKRLAGWAGYPCCPVRAGRVLPYERAKNAQKTNPLLY